MEGELLCVDEQKKCQSIKPAVMAWTVAVAGWRKKTEIALGGGDNGSSKRSRETLVTSVGVFVVVAIRILNDAFPKMSDKVFNNRV